MMHQLASEALELLEILPAMRRARGWRLYGADNTRILDMYLDGGRSVAGRRSGASGRLEKECIDRGLDSSFRTFWKRRLEKEILAWLPGYARVRFFASETEALLALADKDADFADRLRAGDSFSDALRFFAESILVEAPFSEYRTDLAKDPSSRAFGGRLAAAFLPLAPAWSLGVILEKKESEYWEDRAAAAPIPTIKLAAAARSLSDFTAFVKDYGEKNWAAIDPFIAGLFLRSGPWLYPAYPREEHASVFAACLKKHILISPDYDSPSLVPGEFDAGEVSPLKSIRS
jgi:hypothetical protein